MGFIHDNHERLHPDPDKQSDNAFRDLIRILSVIRDKNDKYSKYIETGVVNIGDPCIIVINDSLLQPFDMPMIGLTEQVKNGVSGLPLAVEALLGCGFCFWNASESPDKAEILRSIRTEIQKKNGASIKTDAFVKRKSHKFH